MSLSSLSCCSTCGRACARRGKGGEFRSSYGLRQTTDKMGRYFNMMLVLTVIDAMQMMAIHHVNPQISFDIPLLPLLTILGAIFVGIIELKSVYEKADDKDKGRYRDAARLVKKLMSNPEARSAVERTLDYLKTENEKNSDG